MKKLTAIVCAFIVCGVFVAETGAQDMKLFRFRGALSANFNTSFQLALDFDPENPLVSKTLVGGTTSEAGEFSAEFLVPQGAAVVLMVGRSVFLFWVEPGADLVIEQDENGELHCFGSLASENQFLVEFHSALEKLKPKFSRFDTEQYLLSIDDYVQSQLEKLDGLRSSTRSTHFMVFAKAHVLGSAAYAKNMLPRMGVHQGEIAAQALSQGYFQFWDAFPILDDSAALQSRRYQSALQQKFQYLAEQKLLGMGMLPAENLGRWTEMELECQVGQLAAQPKSNELLFADKIMFMIQYLQPQETKLAIEAYSEKFPNSRLFREINDAFSRSLAIDLDAIDRACVFRDAGGNQVRFSDLKGKVIYLDFWGLWCKACQTHQPDLKSLIEEFAGNSDIVFLSLNFDDSQQDWREHLAQKAPLGLHWKPSTAEEEAKAKELFKISSFPRFMIFDRGKLSSASAPVPASKQAKRLLIQAAGTPPVDIE